MTGNKMMSIFLAYVLAMGGIFYGKKKYRDEGKFRQKVQSSVLDILRFKCL